MPTLAGCARQVQPELSGAVSGVNTVAAPEEILASQEQWLMGLTVGRPLGDITIPMKTSEAGATAKTVRNEFYYLLETSSNGTLYQYIQGMYPTTHVLYGLYFENGLLTALLLDQNVVDFYLCETAFRHGRLRAYKPKPPYSYNLETVNDWVREHNQLGSGFDAKAAHNRFRKGRESGNVEAADVIEGITYLPLLTIATPAYAASLLPPVSRAVEKIESGQQAKRRDWEVKASRIHPGSITLDDLRKIMGAPVSKFSWQGGSGLRYSWPHDHDKLHFGVRNGFVIWKESGSQETPENGSTISDMTSCGELHAP